MTSPIVPYTYIIIYIVTIFNLNLAFLIWMWPFFNLNWRKSPNENADVPNSLQILTIKSTISQKLNIAELLNLDQNPFQKIMHLLEDFFFQKILWNFNYHISKTKNLKNRKIDFWQNIAQIFGQKKIGSFWGREGSVCR